MLCIICFFFRCAGVELDNVTFMDKPVKDQQPGVLLTKSFYPHYAMDQVDVSISQNNVATNM